MTARYYDYLDASYLRVVTDSENTTIQRWEESSGFYCGSKENPQGNATIEFYNFNGSFVARVKIVTTQDQTFITPLEGNIHLKPTEGPLPARSNYGPIYKTLIMFGNDALGAVVHNPARINI
jgi:hypothetical protein